MDLMDQGGMMDLFQGFQSSGHVGDVIEGDSFLDLLNMDMPQGFDHLAGLPLVDGDGLELDSLNEEFDVSSNLALPSFNVSSTPCISTATNQIITKPSPSPIKTSDAFSTIKRLWPDHAETLKMNAQNEKKLLKKGKKSILNNKKRKNDPKKIIKKLTNSKQKDEAVRKVKIESEAEDEELDIEEVDIETVDDDEMNGKSGAEVLSLKLQYLSGSCARVRGVPLNRNKLKLKVVTGKVMPICDVDETPTPTNNSWVSAGKVMPVEDLDETTPVTLVVTSTTPAMQQSPKKVQQVSPVQQNRNMTVKMEPNEGLPSSPSANLSPAQSLLIQSRRESLLRMLPKGAKIKARPKDRSASCIVDKIKQSSQPPRTSILIPHQELGIISSSKPRSSKGPTAVVTPFIPPPLTLSESKPTVIPGVIDVASLPKQSIKSQSANNRNNNNNKKATTTTLLANHHIGVVPAPVYKLTTSANNSSMLKLSSSINSIKQEKNNSVVKDEIPHLPQIRISSSSGAHEQHVTLTASQATSLLQNLHMLVPNAISANKTNLMSQPEKLLLSQTLIKTVNELARTKNVNVKNSSVLKDVKPCLVNEAERRNKERSVGNNCSGPDVEIVSIVNVKRTIQSSQGCDNGEFANGGTFVKNTQKVAPFNRQIKREKASGEGLDHDYCNSFQVKPQVSSSSDAVSIKESPHEIRDPWSVVKLEPDQVVIDSEGVGEVVTIQSDDMTNDDVQIIEMDSCAKSKVRRDSSSSLASSHRSKRHRSSCSPSNSSSSYSAYCRSRSRSPLSYSRSRRHEKKENPPTRKSFKRYSSSRSSSRERSRSRSSWRRNRSPSISWSKSRSPPPSWDYDYGGGYRRFNNRRNSRSPTYKQRNRSLVQNQLKQIEERRVIYVGKIPDGTTKTDLRQRFFKFGDIQEVSVHFRDVGDNYAFVTFAYKSDAYEALEHGNDDSSLPKFDLCFGGRRQFCKKQYSDLDNHYGGDAARSNQPQRSNEELDFDSLLRSARAKIGKSSC